MQQIGERRNAHQERAIVTWNGFAALAIGLLLMAVGIWQLLRGMPYSGAAVDVGPDCRDTHLCRVVHARPVDPRRPVYAAAERGGDPAAVRQLSRQLARSGPARHQSVLQPAQDLAARTQSQRRAAQGQRQARQSDRNRRGRRLARRRHRARPVSTSTTTRITSSCRARPRYGIWPRRSPTTMPTRRPAAAGANAAGERRQSSRAHWWSSCSSASTRPASSSRRPG